MSTAQDLGLKNASVKIPRIDFFQEEISLIVNDSIARVEGVYHFRNNSPNAINMPMAFPFYVDSVTSFPHEIEIYYEDSLGSKMPVQYKSYPKLKVIRLMLPIEPESERTWYLNYEQNIQSKRAVYIITSTAAWSKPLDKATYTYVTPEDFEITETWPEPDTSYQDSAFTYYKCIKYGFMPDRDMEINWR
jgi:hypothetical protein